MQLGRQLLIVTVLVALVALGVKVGRVQERNEAMLAEGPEADVARNIPAGRYVCEWVVETAKTP